MRTDVHSGKKVCKFNKVKINSPPVLHLLEANAPLYRDINKPLMSNKWANKKIIMPHEREWIEMVERPLLLALSSPNDIFAICAIQYAALNAACCCRPGSLFFYPRHYRSRWLSLRGKRAGVLSFRYRSGMLSFSLCGDMCVSVTGHMSSISSSAKTEEEHADAAVSSALFARR